MIEQSQIFFSTKTYMLFLALSIAIVFIGYCYLHGFKMFVIASGSMEPAITLGSLVVTQPNQGYYPGQVISYYKTLQPDLLDSDKIKAYNTLINPIVSWAAEHSESYKIRDSNLTSYKKSDLLQQHSLASNSPQVVTHRIIGLAKRGGVVHYRTKGDANLRPDQELVAPEQIVGRVWLNIPLVGYVLLLPHYKLGFFLIVLVPAIWIILDQIIKIITQLRSTRP